MELESPLPNNKCNVWHKLMKYAAVLVAHRTWPEAFCSCKLASGYRTSLACTRWNLHQDISSCQTKMPASTLLGVHRQQLESDSEEKPNATCQACQKASLTRALEAKEMSQGMSLASDTANSFLSIHVRTQLHERPGQRFS